MRPPLIEIRCPGCGKKGGLYERGETVQCKNCRVKLDKFLQRLGTPNTRRVNPRGLALQIAIIQHVPARVTLCRLFVGGAS